MPLKFLKGEKALILYFINSTNFIKCWLGYNSPNANNTCEMNSKSPYLSLSLSFPPISNLHTHNTHILYPNYFPTGHSLQQFLKAAAATSLTTHIILYAFWSHPSPLYYLSSRSSSRTASIAKRRRPLILLKTLCHRWCHAWEGGSGISGKFLSPSQRGPLSISHRK